MLTVQEARASILGRINRLEPELCSLIDAVGRVLSEDIVAHRTLPAWDNSAMDGYAVRHGDVVIGKPLPQVFEVAAGATGDRLLGPGEVARIFTGAPVPPGADTVIMQEDTQRDGDQITFTDVPFKGAHIRREGSDVALGATVLEAGRIITPGDVGLLATLGRTWLKVTRAPTVAIISTGDELVPVDNPTLARGQIRNSNAYQLAATVKALGCVPRIIPTVPDDRAATDAALALGAQADVMILSGGASVGDHDHVHPALVALAGPDFAFWKVKIKPGKPLAFGTIGRCAVFGLPGNPVSAQVTFEVFGRPSLLKMMGHTRLFRRRHTATLLDGIRGSDKREIYHRASVELRDGALFVNPGRTQSSGALSSMASADALVISPLGSPNREPGETVQVLRLDTFDQVESL
jgi:molybdopterin molybdotransferase